MMTSTTPGSVADKITGGLYGIAYGDAMGMPGELWPRRRVLDHFGHIDTFLPGPDGHFVVDGFLAGQVTDDTQQSMVLAQVIIDGGGSVDAELLGRRLVEWADRVGASEGNFLGPNSARAIDMLRRGQPVTESGATGDTNGAAMRIVPVGLAVPSTEPDRLVETVVEACRPTHFTDLAISGACLIAAAASAAVDATVFDDVIEVALDAAARGRGFGNPVVGPSIPRTAERAVEIARAAPDEPTLLEDLYDLVGGAVATAQSVPTAFALAVAANGNPVRCARMAANLGGDTDTIGAMATGICGAFAGFSSLPPDVIAVLDRVNRLDLETLASGLGTCRSNSER